MGKPLDPGTVALMAQLEPLPHATIPLGSWVSRALCARADLVIFFPPNGGKGKLARQICAQCPVQSECLRYALASGEEYGIWGGLDPRERADLPRRRRNTLKRGAA